MKLEDKDGKENKTHYSYDNLLNLSRTDNADNSYKLTSDTYQMNFLQLSKLRRACAKM
ncbi:MAG TPA: hypothetical protein PK447_02825 [Ignavibacteria bacterium]|nr:hypothetical protein [Ignavibacteria bacterium]